MSVSSGQSTANVILNANNSITRDAGTVTAAVANCPTAQRTVWVGRPLVGGTLIGGSSTVDNYLAYSPLVNKICNLTSFSTVMDIRGESSILWERTAASPTNTTWRKSGDNISSYFFAIGQTATFRLTASNTCGTEITDYKFKSISCSGSPCSQFSVSPNPSSSKVNIVAPNIPPPCGSALTSFPRKEAGEQPESQLTIKTVDLYNFDGKIVRSKQFDGDVKDANLDLLELPKGVYILRISNGTFEETHRIYIK